MAVSLVILVPYHTEELAVRLTQSVNLSKSTSLACRLVKHDRWHNEAPLLVHPTCRVNTQGLAAASLSMSGTSASTQQRPSTTSILHDAATSPALPLAPHKSKRACAARPVSKAQQVPTGCLQCKTQAMPTNKPGAQSIRRMTQSASITSHSPRHTCRS